MTHIIHVHRRPSDPMVYRIDGPRKALEALDPIRARFESMRGHVANLPARIICNCTFDGPAVGLSTIHCFNCDGKGFYDDFSGFTIEVKDFHEFFTESMDANGINIEWSPYSDSRMNWVP